ncbi:hypothetical protein OG427_01380 [Streptomyces sp. NBC_00133]|uniref:hypothetical protein n=1 Tax=Streptomyces sp. NBC_00133 TaxID=2903624 RepID=UPI003249C8CE
MAPSESESKYADELISVVSGRKGPSLRTDLERARRALPDLGRRTSPAFALGPDKGVPAHE